MPAKPETAVQHCVSIFASVKPLTILTRWQEMFQCLSLQKQYFFMRCWVISSHVCGEKTRHRPNPNLFPILTKWFFCLNLTRTNQNSKLNLKKDKSFNISIVCKNLFYIGNIYSGDWVVWGQCAPHDEFNP